MEKSNQPPVCHCISLWQGILKLGKYYDAALASTGLTINQFYLLAGLSRSKDCSVTTLAEQVGQDRTTLVRTLKPLINKGLVTDTSEPSQRERKLRLTKEGLALLIKARPLWEQTQASFEEKLGPERLQDLYEILDIMESL